MASTGSPSCNDCGRPTSACCSTYDNAAVSAAPNTPGRTRVGCRRRGVGKRSRRELAAEYTRRYTTEILDRADLTPIVAALPRSGIAALLCVERDPEACHRSLIAQRIAEQHRVTIEHLRPLDLR